MILPEKTSMLPLSFISEDLTNNNTPPIQIRLQP